jgi:hypothetical protein
MTFNCLHTGDDDPKGNIYLIVHWIAPFNTIRIVVIRFKVRDVYVLSNRVVFLDTGLDVMLCLRTE